MLFNFVDFCRRRGQKLNRVIWEKPLLSKIVNPTNVLVAKYSWFTVGHFLLELLITTFKSSMTGCSGKELLLAISRYVC